MAFPKLFPALTLNELDTMLTDTGSTMNFAGTNANLNTYRATVTVTYTYRGKTYNVSMDTARTGDQ